MWLLTPVPLILLIGTSVGKILKPPQDQINSTLQTVTEDYKPECKRLETDSFRLELSCVLNTQSAHKLISSSLDECKVACCESFPDGPCDFLYWDTSRTCIIMNYHVLSVCPLMAPIYVLSHESPISSTILFSITSRVTPQLKPLLLKKYRQRTRELLGCQYNEFVCNDWTCIPNNLLCNGKRDCLDGSDEDDTTCLSQKTPEITKCRDYSGDYVDIGQPFTPFGIGDQCMQCTCGNNSQPSQCMSPVCHESTVAKCRFNPSDDICCKCVRFPGKGNYMPPINYPESSSTQRLIISCMSVLVIVSLLLFFSRNIVHRRSTYNLSDRDRYLQNDTDYTDGTSSNFWQAWRGMEQYRLSEEERSRATADLPPPYNLIKSIATHDITEPPPSYPGSRHSNSTTSINQQEETTPNPETIVSEERSINQAEDESNLRQSSVSSCREEFEEPISPVSISSTSPLI